MMTHSEHGLKIVGGTVTAGASWLASTFDDVPAWLREFGLPTVMLAGALVAIVFLYKEMKAMRAAHSAELKAATDARITDRDNFIQTMRADADKGEASREALLKATLDQTAEFKSLRREMNRGKPSSE